MMINVGKHVYKVAYNNIAIDKLLCKLLNENAFIPHHFVKKNVKRQEFVQRTAGKHIQHAVSLLAFAKTKKKI